MTTIQRYLAYNMKRLRKVRKFSQADLAEHADTATNYIALLEAGKKFPSAAMIEKLALAYNVDPSELFKASSYIPPERQAVKEELMSEIGIIIDEKFKQS